jgi:predicted RNA-binding protein with PIN domain
LVEALGAIRDAEDLAVNVVFDGRGDRAERDSGESAPGVEVVFASKGQTADGFIERVVAHSPDPAGIIVATADRAERETVAASGVACVSPIELRAWVERCRKRTSRSSRSRADFENRIPL